MDVDGMRFCNVPDHLGDLTVKWPISDLAIFASGKVGQVNLADAVEAALPGWNNVCGVRLRMSTNPNTANLVLTVGPIDGPGNVLAQNELPVGIVGSGPYRQLTGLYDASERVVLADNPPAGMLDLARICRHELGHFLGIGHISDGNLMAPVYSSKIAMPQRGDILEATFRYGPAAPVAPVQPTPPTSPTIPVPGKPDERLTIVDADGHKWDYVGFVRR